MICMIFSFNSEYLLNEGKIAADFSLSNYDVNLFSSKNNSENWGYAGRFLASKNFKINNNNAISKYSEETIERLKQFMNKNIEKISDFLFYFINKGKAPTISDDYLIVTIKNVLYKHFSNIEFQIYKFFDELSNEIDKDYVSNKVNYRSYEVLNYNDYYCNASTDNNDINVSTSLTIYVKEEFKEKYKQITSNICSIANAVEGEYSYDG